jgi:hypothetical protein
VYCRVRPILDMERRRAGPGQDVDVTSYPAEDEIVVKQDDTGMLAKRFEFDRVFKPDSLQTEVYTEVGALTICAPVSCGPSYEIRALFPGSSVGGKFHGWLQRVHLRVRSNRFRENLHDGGYVGRRVFLPAMPMVYIRRP